MNPLFECVYIDSEKSAIELYAHLYSRKLRKWIIICAILAIVFFIAYLAEGQTNYLAGVIIYLLLIGWYVIQPRYQAMKSHKKALKQFDGNIPAATIQFGDEILYQDGQIRLVIPYQKLKNVHVLKNSIVLENEAGNYVQFPNNGFTKGTAPALLAFLKEKCPHLKLPDWKWE